MENVVLVTVPDLATATDVRKNLQRLDGEHGFRLEAAATVQRGADGEVTVHDEVADSPGGATAAGAAIGALVGILTGPLGLLTGGATGAIVGSLVDVAEVEDSHAVVDSIIGSIPPGTAGLVAIVKEPSATLLDRVVSSCGGTVVRMPRGEFELRMAEAELDVLSEESGAASARAADDRRGDTRDR